MASIKQRTAPALQAGNSDHRHAVILSAVTLNLFPCLAFVDGQIRFVGVAGRAALPFLERCKSLTEGALSYIMTTPSREKFAKWVELLAWDLNMANDHYNLFVRLDKSIDNYRAELNQSPWFWNLTLNAHKQVIAFRLCRIFDQHKATLSLPNLLKHIKKFQADIFTTDKQPKYTQLVADMRTVDGKENLKVGNLVFWRNNLFAHLGPEHLEDWKKVEEKYPLTPHVPELIAAGYEILNRYRMLFCNSEHSRKGIGEDDCEGMLKLLRLGLRAQQNRSAD